jgi:hypothetical protein
LESGTPSADSPSGSSLRPSNIPGYNPATQAGDTDETPIQSALAPPVNHTAFLIVGLVCLAAINIILLFDIELTLRGNKGDQFGGDDDWGFGQVLALLLLVIPLRDFVTSIVDIRKKVNREKASREVLQRTFEGHLQQAILNKTFEGHDFKSFIEQGVDPNVGLNGRDGVSIYSDIF